MHPANISINIIINVKFSFILNSQLEEDINILIDSKIIISPIRFLNKVIDPHADDI